ncbi:cytochrome P450, family 718 [Hibiscus trionum]|uniref:Cytochrome P450, family 718 n=1 Tax=Hibiscus trionum TaxID=183268 RepID=A0A9W7LKL3_HIBTR|nr:cytochrome P450, family 718 [Hibiscus trionum]
MAVVMDSFLPWILFCLAAMISTVIFFQHKKRCYTSKRKLPPGQLGLPLLGETMEFYRAQRSNRLFEDFVEPRVAKYGKIFKTSLMGSPTVVVNGAEANRFILSNEFKLVISSWPSSSVQLMGRNSIMEKQGEHHRFQRGLITSSLSYSALETLVPKICTAVQLHLQKYWHGKDSISLYCSTKLLTFTIVFECLLGINVEPQMLDTFERVLEGAFAPPINFPGSKFSRAKKARVEIVKMLEKVVAEKRREMEKNSVVGEDTGCMLLSRLVAAMIRGDLTEEEVIDNIVLLVFAAHDTTSFAIAMTFKMLAQHPDCYSRILQEQGDVMKTKKEGEKLGLGDVKRMEYSWQAARESMRLFPPIFGSFRKAVADIEYGGFTIPKGWKVLWTAYGTHYDGEYFEDPMRYDPGRFRELVPPYAYVPFGGGARTCAGYQLAKLNILIFLHYVVTAYHWSLLHPDESIIMDPLPLPSQGMPINISPKYPY